MPDRIMSDRMPEDMLDRMPKDMPDRMPEDMPDRMPEDMPDKLPEDMPDKLPEDMPDKLPEDMPEGMPDKVPECLPDRMPEDLPDRMPDRMSEDMPEDMPDRVPEDLPVTKCINVRVGITRSKVFFFQCQYVPTIRLAVPGSRRRIPRKWLCLGCLGQECRDTLALWLKMAAVHSAQSGHLAPKVEGRGETG